MQSMKKCKSMLKCDNVLCVKGDNVPCGKLLVHGFVPIHRTFCLEMEPSHNVWQFAN